MAEQLHKSVIRRAINGGARSVSEIAACFQKEREIAKDWILEEYENEDENQSEEPWIYYYRVLNVEQDQVVELMRKFAIQFPCEKK